VTEAVDVLVIGAGPGGSAAARCAARSGLTVLAVEKKAEIGEPVQCAEFVPNPLVEHVRAPGVLRQRVDGMVSHLPSGATGHAEFAGLMVDRAKFDRALAQRARAAGAVILVRARLTALDVAASRARIAVAQGQERDITYRVLIAADGPRSTVARLLGLAPLPSVQTRQYTVPLLETRSRTEVWLSGEFPGGYGWLFPKNDVANVGLGIDRNLAPDLKAPLDRLHAHLVRQRIVGAEVVRRTGGDIPVGGLRARLVHGNVVFVGDAAWLTHPITGAGIAAAVQSGELAGEAAARFFQTNDPASLDAYRRDVRAQYGPSLERALERRSWLAKFWGHAAANDDHVQRSGWIAFPEYFSEPSF
jgi:digeranylgeranylglycerophospholipid reductase